MSGSGSVRILDILRLVDQPDPRTDIDTTSLVARFPSLADVRIRDVTLAGPHGVVRGRTYRPASSAGVGLVWVHGGAFVGGDLDMPESHWVGMELAARGVHVLALDYRKARDGVRHPVLSDEVLAGWSAALADPELLAVPQDRVHLGGASAGGNLSAGVTVRLLAAGLPAPRSLVLVYPALHGELPEPGRAAAAAAATLPPEARFTADFIRAVNLNYAGSDAALRDPVAFPGSAELAGFPPTLIRNAEADDLRASGEGFAVQLAEVRVPVEVGHEPGTDHGYLDRPGLAAALATLDRVAAWLVEGT